MNNKYMRKIIVPSIAFLCVGCNPFNGAKPDSTEIIKSGWAENRKYVPQNTLFCYKTLAEPVCYTHPLKNGETRLHGDNDNLAAIPEDQTAWEKTKQFLAHDPQNFHVTGAKSQY